MAAFGLFFVAVGFISLIIGVMLNINPISVGSNYLSGGNGNPGSIWIIAGIAATMLGVVLLVAVKMKKKGSQKRRETIMVSGIISIITLGVLFIAGGSAFVFFGILTDNAFRNAWDSIVSYWSFGSYRQNGSNPGAIWIIIGIVVTLIGVAFIVIGIIEAVYKRTPHASETAHSPKPTDEDSDLPCG